MMPFLIEPPSVEPVSLAEMKAHLRLSSTDEDDLIGKLIIAARLTIEAAAGCELISQRWRIALNRWPSDGIIRLPLKPLISCDAVRVYSDATTSATLPSSQIYIDKLASPPRIVLLTIPADPGRASGGIEIDVTVGFGTSATSAPENLRQAVMRLAARWFERRGDDPLEQSDVALPADIAALIAPYRDIRI